MLMQNGSVNGTAQKLMDVETLSTLTRRSRLPISRPAAYLLLGQPIVGDAMPVCFGNAVIMMSFQRSPLL